MQGSPDPDTDPPVPQEPDEEQLYSYALQLLDYSYNTDSISKGMAMMNNLSDHGYIPAMYEVARTIGLNKVGADPNYRRRHLGIDVDRNNYPLPIENRKKAEVLLRRILAANDTAFAQFNAYSAFTMTHYYMKDLGIHEENTDSIDYYFDDGIRWAEIAGDQDMAKKLRKFKKDSKVKK